MHYPDEITLTPELKEIIAGKGYANVYKMLAHTPNLAPGFTVLADAIMWSETWSATWRELVIVRVGHHGRSPYEIFHHERIGRMVGLPDEKLAACALGADQSALDVNEQALLKMTDSIIVNQTLSSKELKIAKQFLDPNQLSDFVLTVGFYQMVCNFLNIFDVQIEEEGLHDVNGESLEQGSSS